MDYVETLDYAIEGNTIRGIYYTCLSECETACDADDECVAFTDHFDATPVKCNLKSALSGLHIASHHGTLKNLYSKDVLPPMPPPIPPSIPAPSSPYPPAIESSIANNPAGAGSSGGGNGKCSTNLTYNELLDYAVEEHTLESIEYTCLRECQEACDNDTACIGYVDHYQADPVRCALKSSIEGLHVASHHGTLKNLYTKSILPPMPPPIPPSIPPPNSPYPPAIESSIANNPAGAGSSGGGGNGQCSTNLTFNELLDYAVEGHTLQIINYTCLRECQEACENTTAPWLALDNSTTPCIGYVDHYQADPVMCELKSSLEDLHVASHRYTLKNLYTKSILPPMPPPIPPSTPPPLPPYAPPPVNASWANATVNASATAQASTTDDLYVPAPCSDDLYDFTDYSLETKYAIEGYTIRKLFYTSVCECQEACDADPDCIAFVDNYATEPKKCNLKSGYSTHHEAEGKNLHYNPNKMTMERKKVEK